MSNIKDDEILAMTLMLEDMNMLNGTCEFQSEFDHHIPISLYKEYDDDDSDTDSSIDDELPIPGRYMGQIIYNNNHQPIIGQNRGLSNRNHRSYMDISSDSDDSDDSEESDDSEGAYYDLEDMHKVLTESALKSIKGFTITKKSIEYNKITKEDACSICLINLIQDKYNKDNKKISKIKCGHIFHESCIKKQLSKYDHRCPMCRVSAGEYRIKDE